MRFVEIQEGQSINVECITFFEATFDGRTRISCEDGRTYEVNMPYETFRGVLNSGFNQLNKRLETISRQIATPVP